MTWNDGYYWDNYPFFVYNGYRHRYSHLDVCNYDLVDGDTNSVYRSYSEYTCSVAYDLCADLRDSLNWSSTDYRYFCSERFSYDTSYTYPWNYDEDFYNDLTTSNNNNNSNYDGHGDDDYDDGHDDDDYDDYYDYYDDDDDYGFIDDLDYFNY